MPRSVARPSSRRAFSPPRELVDLRVDLARRRSPMRAARARTFASVRIRHQLADVIVDGFAGVAVRRADAGRNRRSQLARRTRDAASSCSRAGDELGQGRLAVAVGPRRAMRSSSSMRRLRRVQHRLAWP